MRKTDGTYTLKQATPAQMVERLEQELSTTPKWRIFKRAYIRGQIDFWRKQS